MVVLNKSTKMAIWLSIIVLLIASQLPAKHKGQSEILAPENHIIVNDSSRSVEKTDDSANNQSIQNSRADVKIKMQVVLNGAGQGNSADYRVNTLVGQTANGSGSSADFVLSHGFWPNVGGAGPCDCLPGDANNDGQTNVGDAVYIISYVFKGGAPPTPYQTCSGDCNGDCQCNVGDAVYLISYVFKGGQAPVDCQTWSGSCGSLY